MPSSGEEPHTHFLTLGARKSSISDLLWQKKARERGRSQSLSTIDDTERLKQLTELKQAKAHAERMRHNIKHASEMGSELVDKIAEKEDEISSLKWDKSHLEIELSAERRKNLDCEHQIEQLRSLVLDQHEALARLMKQINDPVLVTEMLGERAEGLGLTLTDKPSIAVEHALKRSKERRASEGKGSPRDIFAELNDDELEKEFAEYEEKLYTYEQMKSRIEELEVEVEHLQVMYEIEKTKQEEAEELKTMQEDVISTYDKEVLELTAQLEALRADKDSTEEQAQILQQGLEQRQKELQTLKEAEETSNAELLKAQQNLSEIQEYSKNEIKQTKEQWEHSKKQMEDHVNSLSNKHRQDLDQLHRELNFHKTAVRQMDAKQKDEEGKLINQIKNLNSWLQNTATHELELAKARALECENQVIHSALASKSKETESLKEELSKERRKHSDDIQRLNNEIDKLRALLSSRNESTAKEREEFQLTKLASCQRLKHQIDILQTELDRNKTRPVVVAVKPKEETRPEIVAPANVSDTSKPATASTPKFDMSKAAQELAVIQQRVNKDRKQHITKERSHFEYEKNMFVQLQNACSGIDSSTNISHTARTVVQTQLSELSGLRRALEADRTQRVVNYQIYTDQQQLLFMKLKKIVKDAKTPEELKNVSGLVKEIVSLEKQFTQERSDHFEQDRSHFKKELTLFQKLVEALKQDNVAESEKFVKTLTTLKGEFEEERKQYTVTHEDYMQLEEDAFATIQATLDFDKRNAKTNTPGHRSTPTPPLSAGTTKKPEPSPHSLLRETFGTGGYQRPKGRTGSPLRYSTLLADESTCKHSTASSSSNSRPTTPTIPTIGSGPPPPIATKPIAKLALPVKPADPVPDGGLVNRGSESPRNNNIKQQQQQQGPVVGVNTKKFSQSKLDSNGTSSSTDGGSRGGGTPTQNVGATYKDDTKSILDLPIPTVST